MRIFPIHGYRLSLNFGKDISSYLIAAQIDVGGHITSNRNPFVFFYSRSITVIVADNVEFTIKPHFLFKFFGSGLLIFLLLR